MWLWGLFAERYKNNPWIAGYNLLNEPADPHPRAERLLGVYDRLVTAIRAIDTKHIIFLDGNTYAADFSAFPDDVRERWGDNIAYAIHDYSVFGFPKGGVYEGTEEQREKIRRGYKRKRAWMDERSLCVWNGEWGPVYARREYEGGETDEINKRRYAVLEEQLGLYQEVNRVTSSTRGSSRLTATQDRLSWSIWLYKDIGFQGMVHVSPETPYIKLFKDFLHKKHRLAVDSWGSNDAAVKDIYQPIADLIKASVTDETHQHLYPWPNWSVEERVNRLARATLVAEYLVKEWAEHMRGMEEPQLEELARSFHFENCLQRDGLNEVLRDHAHASGS